MSKKVLSVRVEQEIIDMRDALIQHFSNEIATASSEQVVSHAIKRLYEECIKKH